MQKLCVTCHEQRPEMFYSYRYNGCRACDIARTARWYWAHKPAMSVKRGFQGPPKPTKEWILAQYWYFWIGLIAPYREMVRQRSRRNEAAYKKRSGRDRIYSKVKESRRRGATGKFTKADIDRLFLFQKGKCTVCKDRLVKFDVDHVMPLALGGTNDPSNLQLLCPPCNNVKGAKHPVQFMQERGMLL